MLRNADRQNLEIRRFIFHPILKDGEEKYFDALDLSDIDAGFFTSWLANSLTNAIEYEFINKAAPEGLHSRAVQICNADDTFFVESSKEITDLFKRFHKGSMSDGVLAVALGNVPSGHLLFLVKTNFEHVMAYDEKIGEDGRVIAKLRRIPNPISEGREAIQKVAIINIDSDNTWEVLAQDRQVHTVSKIAEYFKSFLNVREREVASVLTRSVFSTVKEWVRGNSQLLDPEQQRASYTGRAFEYLASHNEFDTQQFVNAIVFDPIPERREQLRTSLTAALAQKELAGRSFEPTPGSITKKEARTLYKTSTGVEIMFTGDPLGHNIEIQRDPKTGGKIITIRTPELIEFT